MNKKNILIVGAGAWGTALATVVDNKGHKVFLKTRNPFLCDQINSTNINPCLSEDFKLSPSIKAVTSFDREVDVIIFAVTSEGLLESAEAIIPQNKNADIIIATKGMMNTEPFLFSTAFEKKHKISPLFLAGPNFAIEVANRLPASCDIACANLDKAKQVCNYLSTEYFTLKPSSDIISVQVASCYKNVLAIYSGYLSALNMGDNFRAKICKEGLKELDNICRKLGGKSETIYSYSGVGDIILSCFSEQSRNFNYGRHIAEYKKTNIFLKQNIQYVEGAKVASSLASICAPFYGELEILPKVVNLIAEFEEVKCCL